MKKRDVILIASILAVALVLLLVVELTRQEGAYVLVRVDGQETGKYELSKDATYELNGGTNILRIENGVAYLTDADCPDKLCVNMHSIAYAGETITCLPNKTVIKIEGGAPEGVDVY